MKTNRGISLFLIWFALSVSLLYGRIRFEKISLEQGLSQSIVETIVQDRNGFLWIGTEDGLNRFDGYRFDIFKENQYVPGSLTHDNILSLIEDRDGILWVGTFYGGLNRFDPLTARSRGFRFSEKDASSINSNVVRTICEDESGNIWIGTDKGLNRFHKKEGTFSRFRQKISDLPDHMSQEISVICRDRPGQLLIGTNGNGLRGFDVKTSEFYSLDFTDNRKDRAAMRSVRSLLVEKNGVVWIGTDDSGMIRWNRNRNTYRIYKHDPGDSKSISNNRVRKIFRDSVGRLWIGTDWGLNLFLPETGSFRHFVNHPNDPDSISHNEIHSIYEDRSGCIWIGTYGGGINKFFARGKAFKHYYSDPQDRNSLTHNIVWTFFEDREGILWTGTHEGGIDRIDRKRNTFRNYHADPANPQSLSDNRVRVLFNDSKDNLWVGTNGGGLNLFDRQKEIFTVFRNDPQNPESLCHDEIRCILEDSYGYLWIGTHGGGLSRFDIKNRKFLNFKYSPGSENTISNNVIRTLLEDAQGNLWIGTYGGGLDKLNLKNMTFSNFRSSLNSPNSLSNNYIFALHIDEQGIMWIGTEGGLNRFDRSKNTFSHLDKDNGLPDNTIYGILQDNAGRFWISTNNGISCYSKQSGEIRNYNERDGLQSNEFNGGAYYRSSSGEMFFGGINGFNAFFPGEIKRNTYIPPVVLSAFKVLNKEIYSASDLLSFKEIELSHRDYLFSVEFAALDYSSPGKNRYAFKLEGLDKDWIYTDARNRNATYTTLTPGRYLFRVKGSNSDGIWNQRGISIWIRIHPPVWMTWWFRLLAVSLLVALVWFGYRRKVRRLDVKSRMEAEIKAAQNAQMSIMPQQKPVISGYDIAGVCIPAHKVGGDFFDYIWTDENCPKFGMVVGDVSGKAMKAAMTAVMASGIVFAQAEETMSINRIMVKLNNALKIKTRKQVFTALGIMGVDRKSGDLEIANAGLPEPVVISNKKINFVKISGTRFPLGIRHIRSYSSYRMTMKPGDTVILLSDGVQEAWDCNRKLFGKERLKKTLEKLISEEPQFTADRIIAVILDEIKCFTGSALQHDDITLVVLKKK